MPTCKSWWTMRCRRYVRPSMPSSMPSKWNCRPHPFAWNRVGVCHYCIHCCVLQQLEPIRRLGYPARVIEPPTEPEMQCSWTVYRRPDLVPDSAYTAVGETPPVKREDCE